MPIGTTNPNSAGWTLYRPGTESICKLKPRASSESGCGKKEAKDISLRPLLEFYTRWLHQYPEEALEKMKKRVEEVRELEREKYIAADPPIITSGKKET